MIRLVQLSVVIVFLLVARGIIYGWLKQPDTLPKLLREGLDALVVYFAYVTVGMLVLSFVAGRGFGAGSQLVALLMTAGFAVYVGAGIALLMRMLGREKRRAKKK